MGTRGPFLAECIVAIASKWFHYPERFALTVTYNEMHFSHSQACVLAHLHFTERLENKRISMNHESHMHCSTLRREILLPLKSSFNSY